MCTNSHSDGYDEALLQTLIQDCRTVVDILHGQKSISLAYGAGATAPIARMYPSG